MHKPDPSSAYHAATVPEVEIGLPELPRESGRLESVHLVVRGPSGTEVLNVGAGEIVTIGRAEDSTIPVDHESVSRKHAQLRLNDGEFLVEDLGSRNGTRLNGEKIVSATKAASGGDVIRVGPVDIVVVSVALRTPEQPSAEAEAKSEGVDGVIVADPVMVGVFQRVRRLATMPTTVLIAGETGVGKEVVASLIHRWSARSSAPFVRINCASLPEHLLEAELFGHEKGAFTGADRRKIGFFEAANGGTLLLDEIGELGLLTQAKLLRALENRVIIRVGSTAEIPIDVRLICATHRNLQEEVAAKRFREDLYYRVNAFTLEIPPLRERPVEVELLANLFAKDLAARASVPTPRVSSEALASLTGYAWPGNVRELRNAIDHAVVLADRGVILPVHLPEAVRKAPPRPAVADAPATMRSKVEEIERDTLQQSLAAHGGNQTKTAEALGISRRTLIYKMKRLGIRS